MPIQNAVSPHEFIQALEIRRLLSLTPIGEEITVPFQTEMSQFDMAVAGDGSFIVVADPIEQPGSPDLIAVRYDANGQQIGTPLTLDDRGFNVSASMNADGDAVVAYQKGSDGLYVVRVLREGVAQAPQRVGTAPAGRKIWETAVSMDDAGGFFVAWLHRDPSFSTITIQLRAFDGTGQPRGPQFVAASGDSTNVKHGIDIAGLPDGAGAVLVYSTGHDNGTSLAFQRLGTQGIIGPFGFVASIGPYTAERLEGDVAAQRDGSFIVGSGRLVDRFDATGTLVGDPVLIGPPIPTIPTDTLVDDVTVDALPNGGFVAGIVLDRGGAVTTYAEHFSPAGLSTNGAVVVDTGGARSPVIGAGGADGAVIAYLQSDGGPGDVHVRRLGIANFAELRGAELFVNGTEDDDHIVVERVRERMWVNVNGVVEGFDASSVQFLSISGLGGDDDIANGTALPSTIHGGDGSDTIWGGIGTDSIRGQGGNDSLRGGDGDDVLLGDTGDDTLHGGDGRDTLTGAKGDDALIFGELLDRVVPGVTFDPHALSNGAVTVVGTEGDDLITLDRIGEGTVLTVNGLSTAFPGSPRFTLLGQAGNDTLLGDINSQEVFDGGPGADDMSGGSNFGDTVDYSSRTTGVFVSFDGIANDGEPGENDQLREITHVIGGAGNDRIIGDERGNARSNLLRGGGGDDTIDGGDYPDTLFGEDGNDDLRGGPYDDHVEGGAGDDVLHADDNEDNNPSLRISDSLFGSAGNDQLFADDGFLDMVRGGPGDDNADADAEDDVLAVETIT